MLSVSCTFLCSFACTEQSARPAQRWKSSGGLMSKRGSLEAALSTGPTFPHALDKSPVRWIANPNVINTTVVSVDREPNRPIFGGSRTPEAALGPQSACSRPKAEVLSGCFGRSVAKRTISVDGEPKPKIRATSSVHREPKKPGFGRSRTQARVRSPRSLGSTTMTDSNTEPAPAERQMRSLLGCPKADVDRSVAPPPPLPHRGHFKVACAKPYRTVACFVGCSGMRRTQVIAIVKQLEPSLREQGLGAIYLFGSVA